MSEGYTARYNRINAGKAWAIVAYTHGGRTICPSCADSRYDAATLSGDGDAPQPLFPTDDFPIYECDTCKSTIDASRG